MAMRFGLRNTRYACTAARPEAYVSVGPWMSAERTVSSRVRVGARSRE